MPPRPRRQWLPEQTCIEQDCFNKRADKASLRCVKHQLARRTTLCAIDGCDRPSYARGWCTAHYSRWRRTGDVEAVGALRDHSNYGTGRTVRKDGYVRVYRPDHPASDTKGYVAEHRVVMEQQLGRPLHADESVHHRNGVRSDNRTENLELWISHQPKGQRPEDLLEWAREIIRRYDME